MSIRNVATAAILAALALSWLPATAADGVDVQAYVRKGTFEALKISPTGEYLAATVPLEDRTGLAILRRSDGKRMAAFALGKDSHIADVHWVAPDRVLMEMARTEGQLDAPQLTGEIYGIKVDGTQGGRLLGGRMELESSASRVRARDPENAWAYLVDDLPADDKYAIVSVSPWAREPFTRAERIDVQTGRGRIVAKAPVQNGRFTTDNQGVVRFVRGAGEDNASKLYYRASAEAEWQLVNDEQKSRRVESVLGFSSDDRIAYLQVEQDKGPDSIDAYVVATGERSQAFRDDDVDPWQVIRQTGKVRAPIGVRLMDGRPRTVFFDDDAPDARLYRSLEKAFPGHGVEVTSTTDDGRLALVSVSSDSNPGDYYLFDRQTLQAEHIISERDWFDPEAMATVEPIKLTARDGLVLHGYLTRPAGSAKGARLPMVVLPHGGPIGVADTWRFDDEAQLLANAGYAVLQVNFRGSSNYGRAQTQAGGRQFGKTMQDDVTDATRWAIAQGHADPDRICIYGASYGAYAALVGVAREPDLYQCAAGYVGLYDLPMKHRQLTRSGGSNETWANDWMGELPTLSALSPTTMADRIKVPVFLAAGGEDTITPIEHTRNMESALKRAGVPVESLYYPTEGHGFYTPARRVEYYTRLLAFLSQHLGGKTAAAGGAKDS